MRNIVVIIFMYNNKIYNKGSKHVMFIILIFELEIRKTTFLYSATEAAELYVSNFTDIASLYIKTNVGGTGIISINFKNKNHPCTYYNILNKKY